MEGQIMLFENSTPAQRAAMEMHYEVLEAAKKVQASGVELGWKLKRMKDSGGYKELGFESLTAYTKAVLKIGVRQTYSYITIVEKISPKLLEENAGAGVTKLALLAQLAPGDREEVAGEGQLAGITVAELQELISQKNGLAEQLTMLQDARQLGGEPVAEVQSAEVDLEEIRREAEAEGRRQAWEEAKAQAEQMQQRAEAEAQQKAVAQAQAEAERRIREERKKAAAELNKKLEKAEKKAAAERAAAVEAAKQEGIAQGEAKAGAMTRRAQEAQAEALARAEALQKQLEVAGDSETTKFLVLFDQLQATYRQMAGVLEELQTAGKGEKADKLRGALGKALAAMMG